MKSVIWPIAGALLAGFVLGLLFMKQVDSEPSVSDRNARQSKLGTSSGPLATRQSRASGRVRLATASEFVLEELDQVSSLNESTAAGFLAKFQDSELCSEAVAELAFRWATLDPVAAVRWLESLETADRSDALVGLVSGWVEIAPRDALAWCRSLEDPGMKETAVQQCALSWAESDGKSAIDAFWKLESDPLVEDGLQIISTTWPADDPDTALAYFASLPADERREEYLEAALVSLTNVDPERVLREAGRAVDAGRQEHIRSQAVEAIAEERPQRALEVAQAEPNRALFLRSVARGWSMTDPAGASAWAATLEGGDLRSTVMAELGVEADDPAESAED